MTVQEQIELYHHGILGQRWGKQNGPPYPLDEQGKAEVRKQRKGLISGFIAKRKEKKQKKINQEKMAKLREAKAKKAEEKKSIEERKAEILKSRSPKALYENANLFTYEELNAAYNKITLENKIKELAPKEYSNGEKFIKGVAKLGSDLDTAAKAIEGGTKFYNTLAKIVNSIDDTMDLPILGEKKEKKKAKYRQTRIDKKGDTTITTVKDWEA